MTDKFDQFLSIGSTPNWISPLSALIQDLTNGPHFHFYVDRYAGWSVNDVKRVLKRHNVRFWGETIADNMIIFTVRVDDANQVQYIMQREDIPCLNGWSKRTWNGSIQSWPRLFPTTDSDDNVTKKIDSLFHWWFG